MNSVSKKVGVGVVAAGLCVFVSAAAADVTAYAGKARGPVWEYDPGPPKNSRWPELFAETPNYRAVGRAVLGGSGEKFRWTFGPMFYRGRLAPESVKVFVVGQEGAQDESVSNRSFTGSTGTKMQNFLNHLGVTESYLFMNTFVYTIHGQYTEKETGEVSEQMWWLAQNPDSPIVRHRHAMFDYMLETNRRTLALVVGVGKAGKDSVVTWVRSHWGTRGEEKCPSINKCDASALGAKVKVIGVEHPGGASPRNGGDEAYQRIMRSFTGAITKVARWASADPRWLPADPGAQARTAQSFQYRDAGVPHRDFAFGSMWRLGKEGTSSNRKTQQAIQVFSDDGCYNNVQLDEKGRCLRDNPASPAPRERLRYSEPKDLARSIPGMPAGEIEWEFPRVNATDYDPGPGDLARTLMGQERGFEWPDFDRLGVTSHGSFGTGQIYRGDLENARVLVLADQMSYDDLFSARALTGEGGQRLQSFLVSMGVDRSYGIIRTLPVDTLDLTPSDVEAIAAHPQVTKVRNRILERVLAKGRTELILTVGEHAGRAIESLKGVSAKVVKLDSALEAGHAAQWNESLRKIRGFRVARDRGATADYRYEGELTPIPRADLPIHTKWWVGTSGSRASRAFNPRLGAQDGNYYKITMPTWVYRLPAKPMSAAERRMISSAP